MSRIAVEGAVADLDPDVDPDVDRDLDRDLDTLVVALRARIDDLDRQVLDLLEERRKLSRRVQDARVAAGGVRIELDREREIMESYRGRLGAHGVAIATALLRVCRGPR